MTSLKEEEPFAFVLKTEHLDNACSFCFTNDKAIYKCKGCHVLSYCNETCQKSDWINHKNECRILKDDLMYTGRTPGNHARLTLRILLKSEKALAQKAFNGRTWDSLEARGEMDPYFHTGVDYIFALLKPVKPTSRNEVVKALRKVISNGLDIIESSLGIAVAGFGVYLGLSIHKHSCVPDSQVIFIGTKASLRTFDDNAEYSTNLTISYTDCPPWTPDRKNFFRNSVFCDCKCPLCTDKNHIMNRMGHSCYVNCCDDGAGILDENSSGPYKCNKCGKVSPITVDEVKHSEQAVKGCLDLAAFRLPLGCPDTVMNKIMDLLLMSEKVLSAYNFQFINLCKKVRRMAMGGCLHGMRRYAQDKELKAVKYYYHEKDRRRATFLLVRTFLKYTLNSVDDFDESQVANALERTFGRDHPVAVKFRQSFEDYNNADSAYHSLISMFLNDNTVVDPLLDLSL